jgi:16S rRNA (uracil1498-N3)-methyltransferase
MRKDRFFVNQKLEKGLTEITDKELVNRLSNVLRKKPGDKILLFNNTPHEAEAQIRVFSKDSVKLEVSAITIPDREPQISISLFCSTLKKDNFELVVQKATEIGIKEIIPVLCQNSVKRQLNFNRLTKISQEAAEQSQRINLPQISPILSFDEAMNAAEDFDIRILFDVQGENFYISDNGIKRVAIFVGPEGGFSSREVELAKDNNFKIFNLGKLILRAETAAMVGSFLTLFELALKLPKDAPRCKKTLYPR